MLFQKIRPVKSPVRSTDGSAGIDFFVPDDFETVFLTPGEDVLIPSGIKSRFSKNVALIAFNKSGVATKRKLLKGAEVIDSDYQGEIHFHIFNMDVNIQPIRAGDKIMQFIPVLISNEDLTITDTEIHFKETQRGSGGFGSTDVTT